MEEQKGWIKLKGSQILDILSCSLLLSFTFFVFGPLQMYLSNTSEFWFKLRHIIPAIIVSFFVVFIIITGISFIIPKNNRKHYVALIFGIGFALYIQGNFINLDYGVLDGTEIDWSSYGILGVLNTVIWIACLTIPIILTRIWSKQLKKITTLASLFIVAVQLLTIGILLFTTDFTSDKAISVTQKDMFSLSPEKNEIVFILDTFDASYMNEVLEKYPEYKKSFEDFTYYGNALGAYPTTKGAVPHILTGEGYDNSVQYTEYVESAYNKTILYDTLITKGYDIGLYTNKVFMSSSCAGIVKNICAVQEEPSSYLKLGLMIHKTTAFSHFPHILKNKVWYYSGDFDKYIDTSGENGSNVPFTPDDVAFYNSLISNKLSINNDAYAFRLYHVNGVHPPYTVTSNVTNDANGTSAIDEAIASLKIVLEYIDQLKEADVYNKTAIIIMADHGWTELNQHPMLMVKPVESDQEFTISSTPVSYEDLLNTMLYLATDDTTYQPNILTWSENDIRIRQYMYYVWDDSWNKSYLPTMYEYITSSAADNIFQMKKTGKVYSSSGVVENYSIKALLGEKLSFGSNGSIQGAFIYGFSGDEGTHIWSIGNEGKLLVALNDKGIIEDELAVSLKFRYIYGSSQRLKCYVNGTFIGEKTVTSAGKPITFVFSPNLISDSGELELKFEYPDAFKKDNSSDIRVLAFAFEYMIIDYAKNLLSYVTVEEEMLTFDFSKDGNSDTLINEGWHGQESKNRWTSDHADITFNAKDVKDYLLTVEYLTYSNSGDTYVIYNGEEIALWDKKTKLHKEKVMLPAELFDKSGTQTVTFITNDAKSPLESGASEDSRVLGLSVRSMTLGIGDEN